MRLSLLFFILFSLFLSCGEDSVPPGVISQEKMAEMLTDIHLAEAAIQQQNLPADTTRQKTADYYAYIFNKYDVDKQKFESSFNYYVEHPGKLDRVYQKVLDEISRKELENK